jgi:hypothetical protein
MPDSTIGAALFGQWSPIDSVWSPWAKPALFAQSFSDRYGTPPNQSSVTPITMQWAAGLKAGTGIVLDAPGQICIPAALQLARMGFRPVPVFNVTTGANAVVDVFPIRDGLYSGAAILESLKLPPDAPPVFVIDAHRCPLSGPGLPGDFDNRWIVFPQDFPSAKFLLAHNIDSIVWAHAPGQRLAADLSQVLLRWQTAGIIMRNVEMESADAPQPLSVSQPPMFRMMWQRAIAAAGFRRNSIGGFGAQVPFQRSGSGGSFFYMGGAG